MRIFDDSLALTAEIDAWTELYYTRGLQEPGDFALSIPFDATGAECLKPGAFILVGEGGKRIGEITAVEKKSKGKGSRRLVARGYEAKALFSRRITIPPLGTTRIEMTAPAETVMKHLVRTQCGPEADDARRFPRLLVADDRGRGTTYFLSCRHSGLLDELCRCASGVGLGFAVSFDKDERKLVFEVIEGVDRSAGQEVNGRALFSEAYDTIRSCELAASRTGYANTLLVQGALLPEGRPTVTAWEREEPQGFSRFEKAADARMITGHEALFRYGRSRLADMEETFFLEAELPNTSPLAQDRDFGLGDRSEVEACGEWFSVPVDSIEERWTKDGSGTRIGFGRPTRGAMRTALKETKDIWDALGAPG